MTNYEAIRQACERANWRKGYGTISSLHVYLDGTIKAEIIAPYMHRCVRKGHVEGNRVRFAGTSAVIRKCTP